MSLIDYLHFTVKFDVFRVMVWIAIWYGGMGQRVELIKKPEYTKQCHLITMHLLPIIDGLSNYAINVFIRRQRGLIYCPLE